MRRQIIAENQIPCCEGGYRITDPMTGQESFANNFNGLVKAIRLVRKANNVPMGLEFEREVEGWCCAKYPQECQDVGPGAVRRRSLGLGDIVAGSRVMLSHWWNGRKVVDRAEAERRAQICLGCPNNQTFHKPCNGMCPELAEVVGAITGAQGTQYDSRLHSCQVCGCFLQAAIWVPLETQCGPVTEEQRAQFQNVPNCWKQCV